MLSKGATTVKPGFHLLNNLSHTGRKLF